MYCPDDESYCSPLFEPVAVSSTLSSGAAASQAIGADDGEPAAKIERPWLPLRVNFTGTAAPPFIRFKAGRASMGWKKPANTIYVGRPTVWGNPYVVGSQLMNGETLTAEKAVELYEQHLAENFNERDIRHCLRDKDLACWCALNQPCHADVLLRIANSRPK